MVIPQNNNNHHNNTGIDNSTVASIVLGTTLVVGTLSSLGWYYYFTRNIVGGRSNNASNSNSNSNSNNTRKPTPKQHESNSSTTTTTSSTSSSSLIKPPFPQPLRDLLSQCRLAYLSTVDEAATSSHLSLMRFTYLHDPDDGEVVIMSTNRKTKKFDMLSRQTGVALLVHNASASATSNSNSNANSNDESESNSNASTKTLSITLNGTCRILSGADETRYRASHLEHNPDYPQFIVGENIAVLCIDVTSARICDLNDNVTKWNVEDAAAAAATTAAPAAAAASDPADPASAAEETKPRVVAQTVRV